MVHGTCWATSAGVPSVRGRRGLGFDGGAVGACLRMSMRFMGLVVVDRGFLEGGFWGELEEDAGLTGDAGSLGSEEVSHASSPAAFLFFVTLCVDWGTGVRLELEFSC